MRIAVRSGSSAGSASATRRARCQLSHAAAMSRVAAHAPARICQPIGGMQIAGGLQVLGDQRGILVSRCRVT